MGASFSLLDVLFFPLTAPLAVTRLAVGQVCELVERELYDEATLRQRLLELHMSYEMGGVSEEAYEKAETILLQRLQDAMERHSPTIGEEGETEDDTNGSDRT